MLNFKLESFLTISGLGAASGLYYKDKNLFIISDTSSYLYQYNLDQKHLHKIKLHADSQENIPKKSKLDFESIAIKNNKLHLLGSGSTANRQRRFTYDLNTKEIEQHNLLDLYEFIKTKFFISDEQLNIEGALYFNQKWHLLQRGNKNDAKNGIVILNEKWKNTADINFVSVVLPEINNVVSSFTDAVYANDKIYFLAAAEDSDSTYKDGDIMGSILGIMNPETFVVEATVEIALKQKFEGICFLSQSEKEIEFLICEDNDTEILETTIYKLTLNI